MLIKEVKICTKATRPWFKKKKLKKTQSNGKISCVHELEK